MKPLYITVKDLCDLFGLGRTKAFELLRSNLIDSVLLGCRRLVSLESVEKYFATLPKKGDK